jgi:hypothetical protein
VLSSCGIAVALTRPDPTYCTLAFHARERPEEPAIGMWGFDRAHFENAKIRLQQRDGYSFQRIANLAFVTHAECTQSL